MDSASCKSGFLGLMSDNMGLFGVSAMTGWKCVVATIWEVDLFLTFSMDGNSDTDSFRHASRSCWPRQTKQWAKIFSYETQSSWTQRVDTGGLLLSWVRGLKNSPVSLSKTQGQFVLGQWIHWSQKPRSSAVLLSNNRALHWFFAPEVTSSVPHFRWFVSRSEDPSNSFDHLSSCCW